MAKIYKTSDKIKVKVDDLIITLSPLTYHQKSMVQAQILEKGEFGAMDSTRLAVKYALKDIEGIENMDGSKYELEIDEGIVSDETIDDLFNLEQSTKMSLVCISLLNGIPKEFVNPQTNEPLDGVSYVKEKNKSRKKK